MLLKLILLLQFIAINWIKEVVGPLSDCGDLKCVNGNCENGICKCFPCFIGDGCELLINKAPVFQKSSYDFMILQTPSIGTILGQVTAEDKDIDQCNEMTCPCSTISYSIFNDKYSGMFTIDSSTGELMLANDAVDRDFEYSIDAKATNDKPFDNVYDTATVFVRFSKLNVNVNDRLGRFKRDVSAPATLAFTLTQTYPTTTITTTNVGQKLTFQLTITFPAGQNSLTVELFAPEAISPVMMLCNAAVVSKGSKISTQPILDPVSQGIPGGPIWPYTKMTYTINNLNNPSTTSANLADIQAVIQFDTYMLYYPTTPLSTLYYVSAGAEYLNATQIWVGQSGYTSGPAVPIPTTNITIVGDTAIYPGSTAAFDVIIYSPGSYTQLNMEFYSPYNDTTILSFCYVNRYYVGASFSCIPTTFQQPSLTSISSNLVTYYPTAIMNLSWITNQLIYDTTATGTDKDTIKIKMTLRTNPLAWPGTIAYVGVAASVTTTNIISAIQSLPVQVKPPKTPYATAIASSLSYVNGTNSAIVGAVSQMIINITVPQNTELDYTITASFQDNRSEICGFKYLSAGANIPCLNQVVLTPTFTTISDNFQVIGSVTINNVRSVVISNLTADDNIQFLISFRPINDGRNNPLGTINSTVQLSWNGGSTAVLSLNYNLQGPIADTNISSSNVPTFTFQINGSDGNISAMDARTMFFSMVLVPGIVYSPATLEFYMPFNGTAQMKICQATITFIGANVICFTKNTITSKFVYSSRINDTSNYDKVSIPIGSLCTAGPIGRNATNDDRISIQVDFIVLNHTFNAVNSVTTINAGMLITSNQIWVGNQNIKFVTAAPQQNLAAPNIPTLTGGRVDSSNNIVWLNDMAIMQYIIKVAGSSTASLSFSVTSDLTADDSFGVCNITVLQKGVSIPCFVTTPTIVTWSTFSKFNKIYSIKFSTIINTGNISISNPSFDANSILLEVPIKFSGSTLPASFNVKATLTYNGGTVYLNTPFTYQATLSRINGTLTANEPVFTFNLMQLLNNGTPNVTILGYGEAMRAILTVQLQPVVLQTLSVSFASKPYTTAQMDVVSLNILSVGVNIPCLKPGIINFSKSQRASSTTTDYVTLNIGTICRKDVIAVSTAADNTIVFEAVFRIWRFPLSSPTSVDINVLVLVNNDEIFISKITIPVGASTTQVNDTNINNLNVTFNASLSTYVLQIGKNVSVTATIYFPPFCQFQSGVIRVYPLWVATYDSALVVSDTSNFTATFGKNVLFNQNEPLRMSSSSSMNTSQLDNIVANLGIIQNPGTTYRFNQETYNNTSVNDIITLTFNIRATDHPAANNAYAFTLIIGGEFGPLKINQSIPVTISRTNSETITIDTNTTMLTNNSVYTQSDEVRFSVMAKLLNGSTLECRNFTIFIASPTFMTLAPYTNASYTSPGFSIQRTDLVPGGYSLSVPYFFLTEQISAILVLKLNSNTNLSRQRFQSLTTIPIIYGCQIFNWPSNPMGSKPINKVTDIRITVQGNPVVIPGCNTDLQVWNKAVIPDCSISGFLTPFIDFDALKVRSNSGAMWKPHIRGGYYNKFRYIDIVFGSIQNVVKVVITSTHSNLPSQIAIYGTMDGRAYSYYQTLNLLFNGSQASVSLTAPKFMYYGIRIAVTQTVQNDSETGLNVDLFGCAPNTTVSAPAINSCPVSLTKPVTTITDFYRRGYLYVAPYLFVCDDVPVQSTYLETYPRCFRVLDSTPNVWTDMGPYVGKVVGYDVNLKAVYAIAGDLKSFVMSLDDGVTYTSINENGWKITKAIGQLPAAKEIPWTTAAGFGPSIVGTNCTTYTANNWNFCYDGVYYSGSNKLSWNTCCSL